MSYDIIGDIHGQAEKLKALLNKLGCRRAFKSDQLCALNFDQGR